MIHGQTSRWTVAGLVLGCLFLLIAGRGLDYSEMLAVLAQARPGEAVLAIIATLGFMALKTLRWSIILRPGIGTSFGFLHRVTYVGSAANLLIVHSGELLRAVMVARRCGVAASAVLASVGIERVFDMLAVLTFLGLLAFLGAEMTDSLTLSAAVAAALAVAALALMVALRHPTPIRRALAKTARLVLPATLEIWIAGQGHVVTVPAAVGVWVLMVLGLTLPSSPAQLGTTQLAYTLGLALTSANDEVAFAASVVYVCTVNLPIMVIGAVNWLMLTRPEREVRRARTQGRADAS